MALHAVQQWGLHAPQEPPTPHNNSPNVTRTEVWTQTLKKTATAKQPIQPKPARCIGSMHRSFSADHMFSIAHLLQREWHALHHTNVCLLLWNAEIPSYHRVAKQLIQKWSLANAKLEIWCRNTIHESSRLLVCVCFRGGMLHL